MLFAPLGEFRKGARTKRESQTGICSWENDGIAIGPANTAYMDWIVETLDGIVDPTLITMLGGI